MLRAVAVLASALCGTAEAPAPAVVEASAAAEAPAPEGPAPAAPTSPAATEQRYDNGISVRVLSGRTWLDADSAPLLGVGVALERDFFEGALAVEFAAEWLYDPARNAALLEVVFEHGFDVTERTSIIVGAGPIFAAALEEEAAFGGLAVIALETELAPRLQLFVELDGAVLFDPAVVLETDLGTGVMWSF